MRLVAICPVCRCLKRVENGALVVHKRVVGLLVYGQALNAEDIDMEWCYGGGTAVRT